MAARLNKRHQGMVREKIRASQLVNRLENHVLENVEMTPTQVNAALGLLKKCVPDLKVTDSNITHDGEVAVRQIIAKGIDGSKPRDS